MVPRDARLVPLSLRAALLLLVPLALLGTVLLGLLAQSATAGDPVTAPSITGTPTAGTTTPTWTYTVPSDLPGTPVATTTPATGTVTIDRSYTGECAFGRTAPDGSTTYDAGAPCNVGGSFTGSVDTDGTYYFSVRTLETEESTFDPEADGEPSTTTTTFFRSAPTTSTYVYDGNAPIITLTGPTGGAGRSPAFSVGIQDATGTTPVCSVDGGAVVTSCGLGTNGIVLDLTGEVDATYTLTVTATDDGLRTTTKTATYVLDAFTLDVAGPTTGRSSTPSWTVTAPGATGFTCNIVGPGNPTVTPCDGTGIAASLPTTGTTGSTYTLTVEATDGLGNTATTTETYLLDNTVDAVVLGPTSPGTSRTPTWTVDADEPVDVLSCTLKTGTTVVANNGSCTDAGYTADELPSADGTAYYVEMSVRDTLGTVQTLTGPVYVLDDTPATLTLVPAAGQGSTDNETVPSWTFAGDTFTSPTCLFRTGTGSHLGGTCSPTGFTAPTLTGPSGTVYTLTVTATDSVGNTSTATTTYTLDTATSVTVTAPTGPSNDRSPLFTFTFEGGATSVDCVLSSGAATYAGDCDSDLTAGTGSFTPTALLPTGDATYTLTVTVTDAVGNPGTSSATYALDTTPPTVTVNPPAHPRNDTTPTFAFTYEPGATVVSCVLSDGTTTYAGTCSSSGGTGTFVTTAALPDGDSTTYTLTVTATDAATNVGTGSVTYLLDTTDPAVAVSSPTHARNDTTPTFAFTYEPGAASVTCGLSNGTTTYAGTCSYSGGTGTFVTTQTLPTTTGTTYTLTVTVVDGAGNSNDASATYLLDTSAPSVLVTAPAATDDDRRPTFSIAIGAGATSTTCTLTDEAGTPVAGTCTIDLSTGVGTFTPNADLPLTDGETYTLTVTATDAATNTGTGTATYVLDTTDPTVAVSSPTHARNDTTPTFAFTFEPGAASVTCALTSSTGTSYAGTCSRNLGLGTGTWTTTQTLPGTTGATYTLTITVTDDAGNTATGTADYLLDTSAPAVDVVAPASPSNNRTPVFTFTFEGGAASAGCVLRNGANTVVAGTCDVDLTAGSGTFTPSAALPTSAGETYTLTVTVVDGAGNSASASDVYRLDTSAPSVLVTGPATPGNDRGPTFTFTFEPGAASVTCALTDAGGATYDGTCTRDLTAGTGSFTADDLDLTDGTTYTLTVTAVDTAGNPATGTATYRLDTTVPTVAVSSPTHARNDTTPTFAFTFEPGAASVTCSLSDGTTTFTGSCSPNLGAGTGTFTASALPTTAGRTYTLTVTATDTAGNSATASATYLLDTTPPTVLVNAPTHPRNDTTPTFAFTFEAGAVSVTCSLSDGTTTFTGTCSPNLGAGTGTFLADALPTTAGRTYTLTVTAVDSAGNSASASASYLLDTTPPAVAVSSPTHARNDTTPTFAFTFEPGAASVTCALTSGSTTFSGTCTPNLVGGSGTFAADELALTPGTTYVLTVTAVDTAGNSASGSATYVLDTTAPGVAVSSPTHPRNDTTPTFAFTFEPGAASVTCSLSDGTTTYAGTCTPNLGLGSGTFTASTLSPTPGTTYTLTVTAVDTAGNSASASATYLLDTTTPAVAVSSPVHARNDTSPTFAFTFEGGAASVTCVLSSGAATFTGTCSPNLPAGTGTFTADDLALTPGTTYTLTVTAVDTAGNSASASATYLLDTSPPAVAVSSPVHARNDRTPTFAFTFEPGATSVTCVLTDSGGGVHAGTCTTDLVGGSGTFTAAQLDLTDGETYTLTVTVVDAATNVATDDATYVLDTTVPGVTVAPVTTPDNERTPTFTATFEPGAASATCALVDGNGAPVTGTCTVDLAAGTASFTPASPLPVTSGETYVFTLTVVDTAGNSASDAVSYELDTVADYTAGLEPSSPGNDTTPSWTWTSELGSTVTCVLSGPGATGGSCGAGGFTATALPGTSGADYVLTVTVVDALGNSTVVVYDAYRLDTIADYAAGTEPLSPGNDTTPSWAWTSELGSTVTCVLSGPGATGGSCGAGGFTATALPGTSGADYVLTVTVVDALGNSTVVVYDAYRLDTVADFTDGTAPTTPGNDTTPTWTWTAEGTSTVTCVLTDDAGAVVFTGACTTANSFTSSVLPSTSGTTYTLTVTVVDAVGNRTTTTLATYDLDTDSDVTPLTAPATPSNDTTPTWTWDAEDGATATCRLVDSDGNVVHDDDCTSAESFTADVLAGTTGTTYTLTITVTDVLGNSTTTTLPVYLLDTVLELDVVGPAGPSPVRAPVWSFTAEPLTTLVCTLTGPDGLVVSGGICDDNGYRAPPLVEDGDYVLTVRGVDAAGNDVTQTFTYDLDTLFLSIDGPTGPSPDRTPTWTFTDEPYVSAHCVLTGPNGVVFDGACTTTSSFTAGTLPLTPGADYVLTVTVVDSIGNEGTISSGPYRLDTQLPVATITVPASPSRVVTVTWGIAVDEPLTSATCELRRDGVVVLSLANCPGSTSVTLPGDGRYDVVVTLVDLAGNESTTTSTVLVHDATVPVAPVVSPTSVTTNRTTATWTITAEGGTSVTTCRVLREGVVFADWATCGATFSLPLGADGSYTLEVVSTDPVGPGPTTRVTYLLDTVAPVAPQLTGPTGPSPSRAPSWTIGTETGTSVECRLLRAGAVVLDWAPCAGSFNADLTGLPDGGYVLEARATDLAGNVSPVRSTPAYVLDTVAPLAPVVSGPTGPSQVRTPSFSWTGESGTRAECQLARDGVLVGGWVSCTSGFAPALDRDGTWTVTVRLTDAAGNVGDASTSGGYVLDTTAPPTPVVTPPQTPGRDLAPSWGVIVETGATLECRLTGPDGVSTAWGPCSLPHVTSLEGRPDGAYELQVRATDVAGNLSPVGSGTYVLDTVAPAAAVITTPTSPSRSRAPTFTFTAEAGSSTRCRITSGATLISDYAPCNGSFTGDLTGLPDGTYTLTVRVSDAAGNPGPAATGTYVLDTTGPVAPVLVTSPASPSPARSVTWTFSYEPGASLVCRLTFPTGAVREISPCASPLTVDLTGLPDGTYTLTVRAVDAAGNVGGVLTDTHVIDSSALAPPTVTGPVTPGLDRTPRWTFTSATATECRLTRGTTVLIEWTSCSSQYVAALFNQPDGTYTLSVRSTSGGVVSAAATSRYVLDTTAPGAAVVVAPPTPSTNLRPVWTIASAELGATAECRVLYFGSVLTDWQPCSVSPEGAVFDDLDLTGRSDGTYTLVVRLTDAVGNRSAVETSSPYVLDTSAPVGVGVTGPQSPGKDPTPTWTFTTAGDLVLECQLTSAGEVIADWDTCEGSFTADLTDLPDGVYVLLVRAVSEAGTPGPATSSQYILSTVAPDGPTALVLSGTKPVDNDRTPTWTFTLPDGTTGRCVLMSGSRVLEDRSCDDGTFTFDLSREQDGSFTLTVYAVSEAGTESDPVTSTYRLDVSAPLPPSFTLVPGGPASTVTVQWRFTTPYGSTPECRVRFGDTVGEWGPCTTRSSFDLDLSLRPDGTYVLEVRAVDDAGNSSEPRSSTYVLDRTAAAIATFTGTPESPGDDRVVVWTFTAPEGYTLECRLIAPDGTTAWESCDSTTAALRVAGSLVVGSTGRYSLELTNRRDGDYVLEVRLVDAAGNRGSTSRATYVRDTRAPDAPTFTNPPPPAGNDALVSWSWDDATDDEVQCRLLRNGVDLTGWTTCTSPFSQRLTSQGTYRLEIRRLDLAGNVSGVASSEYVYDTTPPARPVLSGPPSSGSDRTVSWTFVVPDGATATCTVTRGLNQIDVRSCTSGRYDLDLTGEPDGTYTLTVRFTDAAGNPGQPASSQYVLRSAGAVGGVRPPPTGGSTPDAPTGPGRGGTGVVVIPPQGSTQDPDVPTIPGDEDVPRRDLPNRVSTAITGPDGEEAAGGGSAPDKDTRGRTPIADPLPFDKVDEVIREAVTGTITRPTLPLALLAIVVLFLLAQNRIDRRDPKLASAPVEAEPELDFTLIVRRPGEALS